MEWSELLNCWGGIGGIIAGLSAWLGNFYMYRVLQKEKAAQDKQLELLKTSLESVKEHNIKYTSTQFDSYIALWHALVDLKLSGDRLWEKLSFKELLAFNESLSEAYQLICKSRIFLEPEHYQQFMDIYSKFSEYESGKQKLFKIRSDRDVKRSESPDGLAREVGQIERNGFFRNSYEDLLEKIDDSLKKQLGLKLPKDECVASSTSQP